ncbi:hypothetical protein LTR56_004897 [Elasticomyces elasticus]|nr:hypothetical protein LTR56_004897 [Elasticomyces elasticus]KAK3664671.1 hypothetical protein LTR22_004539 [Elasticomyces elasticus]KAK4913740.1 hypothetical protein LTR49_017997 [Elasticomyces elasticus]KAK5747721.1 hypothetical protein LTS12_022218 [Elasticomyces elasticus]
MTQPWLVVGEACEGYSLRWQVLEASGCVYEVVVSAMAIWLVWDLQTSIDNKVIVIAAFAFRLGMIVIVALRLASFNQRGFATDPTLYQAEFISWTSTELNYSLISATIPIIRPFVNNLSTNYGGGQGSSGHGRAGWSGGSYVRTGSNTKDNSTFELSSVQRSKRQRNSDLPGLEGPSYGVQVQGGKSQAPMIGNGGAREAVNGDATSVDSNDSQKMIIRKDVTWQVEQDGEIL